MVMNNSNEAQKFRQFIDRIERLENERKEIGEEVSAIYKDMGNEGFDVSAVKEVIKARKKNKKKQMEQEVLVDYYKSLLSNIIEESKE